MTDKLRAKSACAPHGSPGIRDTPERRQLWAGRPTCPRTTSAFMARAVPSYRDPHNQGTASRRRRKGSLAAERRYNSAVQGLSDARRHRSLKRTKMGRGEPPGAHVRKTRQAGGHLSRHADKGAAQHCAPGRCRVIRNSEYRTRFCLSKRSPRRASEKVARKALREGNQGKSRAAYEMPPDVHHSLPPVIGGRSPEGGRRGKSSHRQSEDFKIAIAELDWGFPLRPCGPPPTY